MTNLCHGNVILLLILTKSERALGIVHGRSAHDLLEVAALAGRLELLLARRLVRLVTLIFRKMRSLDQVARAAASLVPTLGEARHS